MDDSMQVPKFSRKSEVHSVPKLHRLCSSVDSNSQPDKHASSWSGDAPKGFDSDAHSKILKQLISHDGAVVFSVAHCATTSAVNAHPDCPAHATDAGVGRADSQS